MLHVLILVYISFQFPRFSTGSTPLIWKTIRVKPSGGGDYKSISEAINYGVPVRNSKWVHILVASGNYMEQVVIPNEKKYIFLEGEGRNKTVIAHNGNGLKDAALHVIAKNFIAKGITFKNTHNHALYTNQNPREPASAVFTEGDKHSFIDCNFLGVQDTLVDALGRHYFQNCYIEGFIDFICGDGQSIYKNCTMNVIAPPNFEGFITAQKRDRKNSSSGFVFVNGKITGSGLSKLGRAWGPFSRVIFYKFIFSNVISPVGWDAWHARGKEKNLYYSEVDCIGPGANKSHRVAWEKKLTSNDVNSFIDLSYINSDGWMQQQPIKLNYKL